MSICIQGSYKFHSCLTQSFLHLFQPVSSLEMILSKLAEQILIFFYKNSKVIFINLFFFVIIVFPNKTAILSIFCNGSISDYLFILIYGIKIKDKKSLRIQIIIHQSEGFYQVLFFQKIIQRIANTDNSCHSTIQLKLSHIL